VAFWRIMMLKILAKTSVVVVWVVKDFKVLVVRAVMGLP